MLQTLRHFKEKATPRTFIYRSAHHGHQYPSKHTTPLCRGNKALGLIKAMAHVVVEIAQHGVEIIAAAQQFQLRITEW
ncbi:hypothetical protein [Hoeflea sp.]|uniref:hypothetical protein n=1 Tax=Hoeflea sp. TaxID=1940281 RepID=UPI003B011453